MIVRESLDRFALLDNDFLAENVLNEKLDLNYITDKSKRLAVLASMFLMFLNSSGIDKKDLPNKEEIKRNPIINKIANSPKITKDLIIKDFSDMSKVFMEEDKKGDLEFRDPLSFSISKAGIEFIKKHESLRLDAYELGDKIDGERAVTIGYGHAQPRSKSKYKKGDTITKAEADRLLAIDIQRKEEGVKRMFRQWKEEGIDIEITQFMFDALVSMAYNMGVSGLRRSEVAKALKDGNYNLAAESIPNTRVSNKFPGLKIRRGEEAALFSTGLS